MAFWFFSTESQGPVPTNSDVITGDLTMFVSFRQKLGHHITPDERAVLPEYVWVQRSRGAFLDFFYPL